MCDLNAVSPVLTAIFLDHADMSANKTAQDVADGLALALVEDNADRAQSYWRSIQEAAHRGETLTCAIHLRQVRLLTFSTVETLRGLIKGESEA
jgi:hypothetical protein